MAIYRRREKKDFTSLKKYLKKKKNIFKILYQKNDIAACILNTEIFDFLIDIIPKDDIKSNNYNQQDLFQTINPTIGPVNNIFIF